MFNSDKYTTQQEATPATKKSAIHIFSQKMRTFHQKNRLAVNPSSGLSAPQLRKIQYRR